MKFVDLSRRMYHNMPVYPGDEPVSIVQNATMQKDHYNGFLLKTGLHAGTHIDLPLHFMDGGTSTDAAPLEQFTGRAAVLDARGKRIISLTDEYQKEISGHDIVLIHTGHECKFETGEYYDDYPVIDEEFADYLISSKIKIIGMDTPAPDAIPHQLHRILLSNNVYILENLVNLEALLTDDSVYLFAFPLKIEAEASPVRAVAVVGI